MLNENFVSEYLHSDHQRLDLIFHSLLGAVENGQSNEVQQSLFYLFKSGLLRHIHWEETVLFPLFEMEQDLTQAPTYELRKEHERIKSHIRDMEDTLDDKISQKQLLNLGELLSGHNHQEEKLLYGSLDGLLDKDAQDLVAVAISREFK